MNEKTLHIAIDYINKKYMSSPEELISVSSIVLTNFAQSNFDNFIDFLKDNIEHNNYVSDSIKEIAFVVDNDKIIFKEDKRENNWDNVGSFMFFKNKKFKYDVSINGSCMFISDLQNGKQYLYYAD